MVRPFRHLDMTPDPPDGPVDSPVVEEPVAISPEVALLCQRLRDIYVIEYRRKVPSATDYGSRRIPAWDGGVDDYGNRRQSVWPQLARFIMENCFEPVRYIQAQFENVHPRHPPLPTALMSETAVARYRLSLKNTVIDLQYALEHQHLSLKTRLVELSVLTQYDELLQLQMALSDEHTVSATPLFRYCVALQAGLPQISNYYYPQALTQYTFQQHDYDVAWGDVIPRSLQAIAVGLRQRMNY